MLLVECGKRVLDGHVLRLDHGSQGEISASQLRSVVRYFNLTIDIDKLIEDCDSSGDGLIEYGEFRGMFDNLTEVCRQITNRELQ